MSDEKRDVTIDLELSPDTMDRIRAECKRRGLPDNEDSYGVIITDLILKHGRETET